MAEPLGPALAIACLAALLFGAYLVAEATDIRPALRASAVVLDRAPEAPSAPQRIVTRSRGTRHDQAGAACGHPAPGAAARASAAAIATPACRTTPAGHLRTRRGS